MLISEGHSPKGLYFEQMINESMNVSVTQCGGHILKLCYKAG